MKVKWITLSLSLSHSCSPQLIHFIPETLGSSWVEGEEQVEGGEGVKEEQHHRLQICFGQGFRHSVKRDGNLVV